MKPPKQDFSQRLDRIDPDEKLLAIIKKHPFGLIKMYAQALLGLFAGVAVVLFVLPEMVSRDENPEVYSLIALVAVIVLVIIALILLVATFIYNQSKIVLTDKTITQTLQLTLFNRKVSQLAVSSIEDVTASKAGIFPTLLDYGRLLVETAGEQENFHFDYCPKPDHYAKLILETRQQFMGHREFEMREAQMGYASYSQPQPQQYYQNQYPPQPQPQLQSQQPVQQQQTNQGQPYPQYSSQYPIQADLTGQPAQDNQTQQSQPYSQPPVYSDNSSPVPTPGTDSDGLA